MRILYGIFSWSFFSLVFAAGVQAQDAHKVSTDRDVVSAAKTGSITGGVVQCQSGMAGAYPCQLVDMTAFLDVPALAAGLDNIAFETNDIWGWTDLDTGAEYVLIGLNSGTSFVDINDPENPVVIGFLPTNSVSSSWRDIKVYADHAYIVADAAGQHGIQVFDLTRLRNLSAPTLFSADFVYEEIASAHNIVINEETGFAYSVGSSSGGTTCGGGLHMIDLSTPVAPVFAGCFSDPTTGRRGTGYSHDAQCVVYHGPDTEYVGREICIGSNETAISIADVTDKQNPSSISKGTYPESNYVHQGWLSEDHRYFFQDDELDELRRDLSATRTNVWDLENLDDPILLSVYEAPISTIDHNQYVRGDLLFQSNYHGGLRILDISDPEDLVEAAYFDTYPSSDSASSDWQGSWSNYPFFDSGVIAVSSISEGLFLLRTSLIETSNDTPALPASMVLAAPYPNPFAGETTLSVSYDRAQYARVEVYNLLGRRVAVLLDQTVPARTPISLTFEAGDLPDGAYIIRASADGQTETRVVTLIR